MNPSLDVGFGSQFPLETSLGKRVPFCGSIPGRSFRLRHHPETTSQSEQIFWDAFSVGRRLGKRVPPCAAATFSLRPRPAQSSILRGLGLPPERGDGQLKLDRHGIYFELRLCAENPRICFANPHRLRPPAGVLARGLKTLTRFLYARALHRVRFSAVSISNKKAGRCIYLPACNYWWRRGESNSGPRKPPDWRLQAQSLVLSRTLCAQRHARGVLTGSVLARAIPITCAGAFP